MNLASITKVDQLVPISKARANLAKLIKELDSKDFVLLARKYKPEAALVDIKFLEQLLDIYRKWKREQDFARLDKIRESIPEFPEDEVEKDIRHAIKAVRKEKKNRS